MICPDCGHANAENSKFCSECATPISGTPEGRRERKIATVLFADLVGSTTLAEQEDPEIVQAAIGALFDRLAPVIESYGGLLEKYTGDAILAIFGVPVVHEDDPERAVRAGLEMQSVLSETNRAAAGRPQLGLRIGIESGDILVDLERAVTTRDRMLTGDAVNTAARLQSAAPIGRVLVGPATHTGTRMVIDYSEPRLLELKGKAEPVATYEALRITGKGAGTRPALGLEASMVGRDAELAKLIEILGRVRDEQTPQLVTIFGAAGTGKSRLVKEFGLHLDTLQGTDETFFWRAGRCLPYGDSTYAALADTVKSECEVLDDDPSEIAAGKIERSVHGLMGSADGSAGVSEALKILVGLPGTRSLGKEALFDAWLAYLQRLAGRYPLVVVLEDIHWADEGLLDFIAFLADWGNGAIMAVTLARRELLERHNDWGSGHDNYTGINLAPLSSADNEEMIARLLGDAAPVELKRLITEHAEGNPLYTEEIVRMLIDRGVLDRSRGEWQLTAALESIQIPRSIQALIAARVDGLGADEKATLQDASVVGRVFWSGVTAALAGTDGLETKRRLVRLRGKELIAPRSPSSFSDDHEFGFHHALIRDVAYDSLPKKLRARKHSQVAQWAEAKGAGDRDDIIELIATHYDRSLAYMTELGASASEIAEVTGKAYEWARRAAEGAARVWQANRAEEWFSRAVTLGEELGRGGVELGGLLEAYATVARDTVPESECAELFERAAKCYETAGDEVAMARARSSWAERLYVAGKKPEGISLAEGSVAILRAHPEEPFSLGVALGHLITIYQWGGRSSEWEALLPEAIAAAAASGDRRLEAETKLRAGAGRWPHSISEATALYREARDIAAEIGDLGVLLRATNGLGIVLGEQEKVQEIFPMWREAIGLARRHGVGHLLMYLVWNLGEELLYAGELDEARENLGLVERETQTEGPDEIAAIHAGHGYIDLVTGDRPAARRRLEQAERTVAGLDVVRSEQLLAFLHASLLEPGEEPTEAGRRLYEACTIKRSDLFRWPACPVLAVRMLAARGESDKAKEVIESSLGRLSPRWRIPGVGAGADDLGRGIVGSSRRGGRQAATDRPLPGGSEVLDGSGGGAGETRTRPRARSRTSPNAVCQDRRSRIARPSASPS